MSSGTTFVSDVVKVVPSEMWLEIFSHLPSKIAYHHCEPDRPGIPQLPTYPAVCSVSLTCKVFRQLVQPILFRELVVSHCSFNWRALRLRTSLHLIRTRERLKALSSDRFAHMIKHCRICPSPTRPEYHRGDVDRRVIVDLVLKFLPRFPNLRTLVCESVCFSKEHVTQIRQLPLKYVSLLSCETEVSSPPIAVQRLDINHFELPGSSQLLSQESYPPNTPNALSLFLHPDHIRDISVLWQSRSLLNLLSAMGRYPLNSLRSLKVSLGGAPNRQVNDLFISALSQCPNLEDLNIFDPMTISHSLQLPPNIVPTLKKFRGPHRYITAFSAGRPLQDVTLVLFRQLYDGNPRILFSTFRELRDLGIQFESCHLTILLLEMDCTYDNLDVPDGLHALVSSYFPQLNSLDITVKPPPRGQAWSFENGGKNVVRANSLGKFLIKRFTLNITNFRTSIPFIPYQINCSVLEDSLHCPTFGGEVMLGGGRSSE